MGATLVAQAGGQPNARSSTMNRWINAAVVAVSVGSVPLGLAQPMTREGFTEFIRQNEAALFSSATGARANLLGTQWQFNSKSDDPVSGRSFSDAYAQMQADSSNGGEFTRNAPTFPPEAAEPVRGDSFARTFARMQAESSSSGQFRLPVPPGPTRYAKDRAGNAVAHAEGSAAR
jgi:hypothetical protein